MYWNDDISIIKYDGSKDWPIMASEIYTLPKPTLE